MIDVWRTAGNIGRTLERIEHILTSQKMNLQCRGVKIYNGEENDFILDHYPDESIFEIETTN